MHLTSHSTLAQSKSRTEDCVMMGIGPYGTYWRCRAQFLSFMCNTASSYVRVHAQAIMRKQKSIKKHSQTCLLIMLYCHFLKAQ
jgi:hypothetical protein